MATSALPIADSVQSMMSMIPADVMAEVNTAAEGPAEDTPDTPEVADAVGDPDPVGGEEAQVETEVEETPDGQTEPPAAEEQPTVAATEELPEGVKAGKDRNGKPLMFVEENRWKNSIYPNHQLVQKATEILGEPLTLDGLKLRNDSFMAQERLFDDLNSADHATQGNVLGYILDGMKEAHQNGEVGADPAVSLAGAFYNSIREKSPEGYANLRFSAAKDLISEMFEQASQTGSKGLFASAQQIALTLAGVPADKFGDVAYLRQVTKNLGIPFHAIDEMSTLATRRAVDPQASLRAENERLKAQLNGRSQNTQAEQVASFRQSVNQQIAAGMQEAITPALASVADAWKSHPQEYKELVVDRLNKRIYEVLAADTVFSEQIRRLDEKAQRATNPQVRQVFGNQIKTMYVNRAKQAAEAVKRPILDFAANTLAAKASATNGRREAAQSRTAPKDTTTSVPRSLVPNTPEFSFKDGKFDPAQAVAMMRKVLPR